MRATAQVSRGGAEAERESSLCYIFYFLSFSVSVFFVLFSCLKQTPHLYERTVFSRGHVGVYCHASILSNGSCGLLQLQYASCGLTVSE